MQRYRGRGLQPRKLDLARADNSSDDVVLVDEHDVATGLAPKLAAHRRGLRHRAISVIVGDRQGRLLLQQRAAGKYHSAGLWSNTCCSHPRHAESVADAARRRLAEEMGIVCPLTFLFTMAYRAEVPDGLIEDEIVHVFAGSFDGTPDPDPREVSDWCWRTPDEVAADIDRRPEAYTIWFRELHRRHWGAIEQWLRA